MEPAVGERRLLRYGFKSAMDPNYDCRHVVEIEQEPRHHLVFENEYVRAFAVEIAPHERTLCHHHPNDYLLYVANGAEIISSPRDEEPKRFTYRDGECELSPAGLKHVVENLGDKPFRNVVVELLPRAGELRRGAEPEVSAEDRPEAGFEARTTLILHQERAAIFRLEIEPGASVEISGPAVVATPYENKLNPEALGDIQVWPHPVCDFAWVPANRRAVLWGCWEHTGRAIVFQIGRTDEQGYAVSKARTPLRSLRAAKKEIPRRFE